MSRAEGGGQAGGHRVEMEKQGRQPAHGRRRWPLLSGGAPRGRKGPGHLSPHLQHSCPHRQPRLPAMLLTSLPSLCPSPTMGVERRRGGGGGVSPGEAGYNHPVALAPVLLPLQVFPLLRLLPLRPILLSHLFLRLTLHHSCSVPSLKSSSCTYVYPSCGFTSITAQCRRNGDPCPESVCAQ